MLMASDAQHRGWCGRSATSLLELSQVLPQPYGSLTGRDGDPGQVVLAVAVQVIRLVLVLPAGWFQGSRGAQPRRAPATARDG